MEIRKVQKTGGSSYIVSLPKTWADEQGVKEKDKVGILVRDDGTLVVIPNVDGEREQKVKRINIDELDVEEGESLFYRLLVASYFQGYNKIIVTSEKRLELEIKNVAREFIQSAIGLEIMEETPNSLTIKDLLNPTEMKFKSWIERISQLVGQQINDALLAIRERNADLHHAVIDRDKEVNRINWLISRQHTIISTNLLLSDTLRNNDERVANYSLISRIIEHVGDHAVRIAKNGLAIMDYELDDEIVDQIIEAGKSAQEVFFCSIDAFFNEDLQGAHLNIEKVAKFVKKCEEIENQAPDQGPDVAISLGYIVESIRRTAEYGSDLSEYIINFLVGAKEA